MKTFITAACFLSLAANLSAFELPALDAAKLRETSGRQELPTVRLKESLPVTTESTFEDWQNLRAAFFRAEAPAALEELVGEYSGYLHPLYEREDYTIEFRMSIYRDSATGAFKATFPLSPYGMNEVVTLELTKHGAAFANAWEGRAKLLIRKYDGKLYIMSNLYSEETYGVCSGAGNRGEAKDLTALKPTGNLEDDMPHGAIPSYPETDPAARLLKNEFGVAGLSLDIPAPEITRQEKAYGGMKFEPAFRAALKTFFNDSSSPESPLCIILGNLGASSCDTPSKAEAARAQRKLRELMSLKGSKLSLVRNGGGHQPENVESVGKNWIFYLYLDYSDHTYWGIVDRAGKVPAYNYGFN